MRIYRKLRQIIQDTRRHSVLFYNEVFAETRVVRLPGETMAERDWRALCGMARWYQEHLGKPILLLSEAFKDSGDSQVEVLSMKAYLDRYWPSHSLLQNLVHVLAEAVLEEDLERIRIASRGRKSEPAVSGYTEVFLIPFCLPSFCY